LQWGDVASPVNVASIRKTLLSALYGRCVDAGEISLGATLAELGIDDSPPSLSPLEKQATVADLLRLRSGVYHPANYETPGAKAERPERGSHQPGTFYYYNNWDANVLGTIFSQETGRGIFEDFATCLAAPLQMQDFDIAQCEYRAPDLDSWHPAYLFRISARDLARFGLLYLRGGRWSGKQIIPLSWIRASLIPYSITGDGFGFGYMWNVAQNGKLYGDGRVSERAFGYSGWPGHFLVILPEHQLVVVYYQRLVDDPKTVSYQEFGKLMDGIIRGSVDELTWER
jgi:CubicO group peptidase (beta-lactamase class C family)